MNSTIADKEDILKFGLSTESIVRIENKVNRLRDLDKDIKHVSKSLNDIHCAITELSKVTNPIHSISSSKSTISIEEMGVTESPLPILKKLKEVEIDLFRNIEHLTLQRARVYGLNGIGGGVSRSGKGGLVDLQNADKPKGSARSFHLESFLYFEWLTFTKTIPTFSIDSDFVVFCSYFLQKSLDAMIKSFSRSGISSMSKNLSPIEEWTFPPKKP